MDYDKTQLIGRVEDLEDRVSDLEDEIEDKGPAEEIAEGVDAAVEAGSDALDAVTGEGDAPEHDEEHATPNDVPPPTTAQEE